MTSPIAVEGAGPKAMSTEVFVGIAMLGIVAMLVVPLPAVVLDFMLAVSIAVAAVVFLTAVYSERPTDFSIFPTLLLSSTLLRLSLNIASTRLILGEGQNGADSAGQIIQAFSAFVVGGNTAVGTVVFLALVVINFVVITKGSGRIAEVSARFNLDAMPGKQMSIDAELNSGSIDETEARRRREDLYQQADFYGAMDGSSKFIRGDAVAGLVITGINLVGGFAIGILQHGLSMSAAANTYPQLTIGDGLVSQIPALVVSTAAGIAITRASGRARFGDEVVRQMLGIRNVLYIAAGFLILIGLLPGLPLFPFTVLAGGLLLIDWRRRADEKARAKIDGAIEAQDRPAEEAPLSQALHIDDVCVMVGFALVPLVESSLGSKVKSVRQKLARELGVITPTVKLRDELLLQPNEYAISIQGIEVGRGDVYPNRLLAFAATGESDDPGLPDAIETREPMFGLKAWWIRPEVRARAEGRDMVVVEPETVIATHLSQVVRDNAAQLLGRDQLQELLDMTREKAPRVVEQVGTGELTHGIVLAVLKGLLREKVSIRNLKSILETLAQAVAKGVAVAELVERARAALRRQISSDLCDEDGAVHAVTLDEQLTGTLARSMSPTGQLTPDPAVLPKMLESIERVCGDASARRQQPAVILVPDQLRRPLFELLGGQLSDVRFIAFQEYDPQFELRIVGTISAG